MKAIVTSAVMSLRHDSPMDFEATFRITLDGEDQGVVSDEIARWLDAYRRGTAVLVSPPEPAPQTSG